MNFKLILSALVIIGFAGMGVTDALSQRHQLKVKNIQLHSKSSEIEQLRVKHQQLNVQLETELKQNQVDSEKVKQLEQEKKQLEERTRQLEARKAEKSRLARLLATKKVSAQTPNTAAPSGSCADWIRQAGITDVATAMKLIGGESGCRVNATNPSSGAYGIPQALPAGKMASAGADWRTNPVTQLRWMDGYIKGRYGSWANAYATWQSRNPHWY